jgi:hypothetical protein
MRCRKTFAVLLAALLLFTIVMPAYGLNRPYPTMFDESLKNHPWQDDNQNTDPVIGGKSIAVVIGPFIVTVPFPFTKTNKTVVHKSTVTKKVQTETSKNQKGQ